VRRDIGAGFTAYLEFLLAMGLAKGLLHAPTSLAYLAGESLGALAYHLDRKHREIAKQNLQRAYDGRLTPTAIDSLVRSTFINLGRTAVETCRIPRIDRESFRRFIEIEGYEHYQKAKDRGRGVIYITAHLGSWELLPVASALVGEPLWIVVRPLDNPYLDRAINRMRMAWGTKVLPKKWAMRGVLGALHRGESVGILIDQNIAAKEGVFVEFFGVPACTAFAPALLALRTDASVLPAAIFRRGRDRHRIVVGEQISLIRTGQLAADLVANTAAFTRAIEAFVRTEPAQWLWVHRRWKTQPPPEPSQSEGVTG
jgi:KDO2-lipid IV(A) lauroyltransferase